MAMTATAIGLVSCAEPVKRAAVFAPARAGAPFEQAGKVELHEGQPCTSQIMFDFRGRGADTVWLAASMRETKVLTQAARTNHRVHVYGTWRRGKEPGCSYVSVTRVRL